MVHSITDSNITSRALLGAFQESFSEGHLFVKCLMGWDSEYFSTLSPRQVPMSMVGCWEAGYQGHVMSMDPIGQVMALSLMFDAAATSLLRKVMPELEQGSPEDYACFVCASLCSIPQLPLLGTTKVPYGSEQHFMDPDGVRDLSDAAADQGYMATTPDWEVRKRGSMAGCTFVGPPPQGYKFSDTPSEHVYQLRMTGKKQRPMLLFDVRQANQVEKQFMNRPANADVLCIADGLNMALRTSLKARGQQHCQAMLGVNCPVRIRR